MACIALCVRWDLAIGDVADAGYAGGVGERWNDDQAMVGGRLVGRLWLLERMIRVSVVE